MTLTVSNVTTGTATDDTADLTIVYGSRSRRIAGC